MEPYCACDCRENASRVVVSAGPLAAGCGTLAFRTCSLNWTASSFPSHDPLTLFVTNVLRLLSRTRCWFASLSTCALPLLCVRTLVAVRVAVRAVFAVADALLIAALRLLLLFAVALPLLCGPDFADCLGDCCVLCRCCCLLLPCLAVAMRVCSLRRRLALLLLCVAFSTPACCLLIC